MSRFTKDGLGMPPERSGTCRGAVLQFTDVCYEVHNRAGNKTQILKGVTGECQAGRFLAIMGPSGAGKTSLINILARQKKAEGVRGTICINGNPLRAAEFRRRSCYVLQQDVLLPTATVREAITSNALLRLPQIMARAEKEQRILDIIQQLELGKCADTLIGDDTLGAKGISGGEKRRLSVAIGLVTDPEIVLLDEPTSGLDSETASQLISCLVKLAKAGRTVIATIHQPNSQISACFDDLLLLGNGRSIFYGPYTSAVPYFTSIGFKCPLYSNPSDFFLTVCKDFGEATAQKWEAHQRLANGLWKNLGDVSKLAEMIPSSSNDWSETIKAERMLDAATAHPDGDIEAGGMTQTVQDTQDSEMDVACSQRSVMENVQSKPATTWCFQVRVLFVRFLRTWIRSPFLLTGFLVQYIFSGVFIGLMYLQLGNTRATSLFDRQASLFVILIMLGFTPSNSACTIWNQERTLLRREANSGAYKLSTFFVAKTLATWPIQAFVTLVFSLLVYYIVGYQAPASKFFTFFATALAYQLTAETLGVMCAIMTRTAITALILSASFLMVLVAFSGFLISHIPVFFRWVGKISFVSFAYSALYHNEFSGLKMNLTDQKGLPRPEAGIHVNFAKIEFQCLPSASNNLNSISGENHFTLAQNLGVLVSILISLRILAFVLLCLANKLKRL